MALQVIERLVDDLDGESTAQHTISFAYEGVQYKIDLNEANAAEMRALFEKYANAATPVDRKGNRLTKLIGQPDRSDSAVAGDVSSELQEGAAAAEESADVIAAADPTEEPKKTVPPAQRDTSTYKRTDLGLARPDTKTIRAWAKAVKIPGVGDQGRLKPHVVQAYKDAHDPALKNGNGNGNGSVTDEAAANGNGKVVTPATAMPKKAVTRPAPLRRVSGPKNTPAKNGRKVSAGI